MKNNQKIPEGWGVKKIRNAVYTFSGGTPSAGNLAYYKNGTIPFIRSGEIYQDFTELFITEKGLQESSAKMVNKGDLLFALYGANSGEIAISQIEGAINQAILCIRPKEDNVYYLKNSLILLKDRILQKYLQGGQGNLSAEIVKSLKLLFPPLPEQEKIAGILGTWDEAIEKLSGLIEQKKLLKKGLMQRLLTGKTRLNGFTQPWKDIELSDLLNYEQPSKYLVGEILPYDKNKIPVLTANKAFILGSTDDSSGIYTQGDCIIFDDFTTDIKYVNFPFKVKSSAIKILTPKTNTNLKFVYEQMKCIKYPLAGHKRYYLSEYQYITISIPDISEQQAIADVLSTADEEIDLLNKKLEALKEQKKGLMQQLLTGQIRVKVN